MVNTYTKRSLILFCRHDRIIAVVVGSFHSSSKSIKGVYRIKTTLTQEEDQQNREVEGKACQEGNQEAGNQEGDQASLEVRKAWGVVLTKEDPLFQANYQITGYRRR
jgi:hypothetical protein